jgi:hypothetical protein
MEGRLKVSLLVLAIMTPEFLVHTTTFIRKTNAIGTHRCDKYSKIPKCLVENFPHDCVS